MGNDLEDAILIVDCLRTEREPDKIISIYSLALQKRFYKNKQYYLDRINKYKIFQEELIKLNRKNDSDSIAKKKSIIVDSLG